MARPERRTVDYFPFYCDQWKKMFYLEQKHWNDGFAVFIKLLRELAVTEDHYITLTYDTKLFISSKCLVSEEKLLTIIDDIVKIWKFDQELWENFRVIWCQDFIDSISDAYKDRKNQLLSKTTLNSVLLDKTPINWVKPPINWVKPPDNTQRKEKDSKEKKNKEEDIYTKIYFPNEKLNFEFLEFLKLRKKKRTENTPHSIDLLLDKLKPFNDQTKIKMIQQSYVSWRTWIFELRENLKFNKPPWAIEWQQYKKQYVPFIDKVDWTLADLPD